MKNRYLLLMMLFSMSLYSMEKEKGVEKAFRDQKVKQSNPQKKDEALSSAKIEAVNLFAEELGELYENNQEEKFVHAKIINRIFNKYKDNPDDIDYLLAFANKFLADSDESRNDQFLELIKDGCLSFIARAAYTKKSQIGSAPMEKYETTNGWVGKYDAPYLRYKTYGELRNAWFTGDDVNFARFGLRMKKGEGCIWLKKRNLSEEDSKRVADLIFREEAIHTVPAKTYYGLSYCFPVINRNLEFTAVASSEGGALVLGCNNLGQENGNILLHTQNGDYEVRCKGSQLSDGVITDLRFSPQDQLLALAFSKGPYVGIFDYATLSDAELVLNPKELSEAKIEEALAYAKKYSLNITRDTKEKSYIESEPVVDIPGISKFRSLFVKTPAVKNIKAKVMMDGGHTAPVVSVGFSPKTSKLLTAGNDKKVHEWINLQDTSATPIQFERPVKSVAYSQVDDNLFAVAGDEIKIFDSRTRREADKGQLKFGSYASCVRGSPDGNEWIAALYKGYMIYDQRKAAVRVERNLNKSGLSVEFCPDGKGDYSVQTADGFQLFDLYGNMKRCELNPNGGLQAKKGCFYNDGKMFAIVGWYSKLAWNNPSRFCQGTTLIEHSLYDSNNDQINAGLLAEQALEKRYLTEVQNEVQFK